MCQKAARALDKRATQKNLALLDKVISFHERIHEMMLQNLAMMSALE